MAGDIKPQRAENHDRHERAVNNISEQFVPCLPALAAYRSPCRRGQLLRRLLTFVSPALSAAPAIVRDSRR
jgi:hypothetical protein